MHFIQGQTHTGTHVEAPYKYSETGLDVGSMPLESYLGEAAACDFSHKAAGQPITPEDFSRAGVRRADIVLAWGSAETADEPPYLTFEAVDWLIETRIKAIGIENLLHAPPGTPFGDGDADSKLLLAGIVFIDAPKGLDQIKKPRVFFIGLPVKLRRVTASWTRAIALEELD
jgi:kynurenine formamidase